MQNNIYQIHFGKETPTFNIRKMPRRAKNSEDHIFTPEAQNQKNRDLAGTFSNGKRQKQFRDRQQSLGLNFEQDTMVVNSKLYQNLKATLFESRKRNVQQKNSLLQKIERNKLQKQQALVETRRLLEQKTKYLNALKLKRQKLISLKQANERYQEMAQNRMNYQTEYLTNLIMSMRMHAEYQHNIDPDQMTYEELLQLEQKIGSVSRGINSSQRARLEALKFEVQKRQKTQNSQVSQEQPCSVCYCAYENGQFKSKISCGHQFHFQCVKRWFQKEKVCPLCKQQIFFDNQAQKQENNQQIQHV